jgi:hypothetical protein
MSRMTSLVTGLVLASSSPIWAQKLPFSPKASAKANAAQSAIDKEQDRRQQLKQAKRNFSKAEMEAIAAANREIAEARAAHRAAVKEFQATKESVEKSVEDSLGAKKLREEAAEAQKAYREAADPVLHELKGTSDYQKAEKASAAAKAKIKELQDDSSLSAEDRKSRLQGLVNESMGASNLERAALQKDPRVKAARERLEGMQKKLAELQKKAEEKIEKDSTVTAAQEAVKNAHAGIQAAEARLATVEGKAAVGEQMLQAGVIPRAPSQGGKRNNQGKGGKKN